MPDEQKENENTSQKEDGKALEIEEIVKIKDEDKYRQARDKFLEKKLVNLQNSAKVLEISVSSTSYKGFIHPNSEVKPTLFLDGFRIDDPNIYSNLLDNIRAYKKDYRWESKSIREINPYAVTKTLGEYFGNYIADKELESRHHRFYMDHSSANSEALSLSELKGLEIAMCTEKAAVAQNLLTLLGYDSELCLSQGCELVKGKKEMHAFNILSTDKGKFIFEPTNPIVVSDDEGNLVNIIPAIYGVSSDQYKGLMSGEEVDVEHTDFCINKGKYEKQEMEVRKYGGMGKNSL